MKERQEERLEPSLEREGAGGRLKPILMKKGLGLMEVPRACPRKKELLLLQRKNRAEALL